MTAKGQATQSAVSAHRVSEGFGFTLSLILVTICAQVFPRCFIGDEASPKAEKNVPRMTRLLETETQLSQECKLMTRSLAREESCFSRE